MTETKEIILKLKEVRKEKNLSYSKILTMLEENNAYVSKSTLSRVFADGSEDLSFDYEGTIKPIANALLDIDTTEETDNMDVQAMKSLLRYKSRLIEELEAKVKRLEEEKETALAKEKVKYHEKLEKERERHSKSVEFLKEQISLKDKRMDQLLEAVFKKDIQMSQMNERFLTCQLCKEKHK